MNKKLKLKTLCDKLLEPSLPLHSRTYKMQKTDLYIKRDDELNFGISGSKLRKYASLLPFLKKQNKTVALIGSPYSNHILSLTQLLKQTGIPYQLFLEKTHTSNYTGNFFFLSLLTSKDEIIWIDKTPELLLSSWTRELEIKHKKEFVWIPMGGCMPEALPGAFTLSLDILENEKELQTEFSHIFIDSGTGLTAAALILCHAYFQKKTKIHVVLVAGEKAAFEKQLLSFKSTLENLVEEKLSDITNYRLLKSITAKSFGSCNSTVFKTIAETARSEGFFLDPLYTAKLLLTAKDTIKKESLEGDILWIHSGGALSLSGFQDSLTSYLI